MMTREEMERELEAIIHRVQVKRLVGVVGSPEESYEWDRAVWLWEELRKPESNA